MLNTFTNLALCLFTSYLCTFITTNDAAAVDAGFKYCLYECANCMDLWGDYLYDGEKCATCCRYSNGIKVDPECKVWVTNSNGYTKKDREYVNDILVQRKRGHTKELRKRWDEAVNYSTIFGSEKMPSYCFK